MRVFYTNLVECEVILVRTGEKEIVDEIRKRKWWWIGHFARREDGQLAKQAITFKMEGQRRVGRPRETWARIAKREFEGGTGLDFDHVTQHASSPCQWRQRVDAVRAWTAHRD